MASKNFTPAQWRVVERIGDIVIPGDETLPAFSACGFYTHVDRLADSMQKGDLSLLKLLLMILRFMPDFVIRFILFVASKERYFPGFIGVNLRKLITGLRGIIFSLYYSFLDNTNGCGQEVKEALAYDAAIRTELEEADDLPALVEAANPLGQ